MAFNFEDSPIYLDVKKILESPSHLSANVYKAKLHTEVDDIPIIKIVSFNITRDYQAAYSDYMYIELTIGLGDYVHKVYPYRDNLEASVKIEQAFYPGEDNTYQEKGDDVLRYRAIFDPGNQIPSATLADMDINLLNNSKIITLKLQLLEVCSLPIMISRIYGNHSNKDPETLLREVIGKGITNIEIDGKAAISSIDIYEPDNKEAVKHLVIKDGSHLVEFPKYLQNTSNGVYLRGLGSYFQYYEEQVRWFIYPLFDTTRYEKDERKKLIIYNLPTERFKSIDRTVLVDGDIISILVLDNFEYVDNNGLNDLNEGGGFKMQAASTVTGSSKVIKDQKIANSRTSTVNEVLFRERNDKLNYSKQLPTTNNVFKVYSAYNMRSRAELIVQWNYADYNLIYPGMPLKYVFFDGEDVVEIYGNVAAMDCSVVPTVPDLRPSVYSTTIALRLFIEPVEKLNTKETETQSFGDF